MRASPVGRWQSPLDTLALTVKLYEECTGGSEAPADALKCLQSASATFSFTDHGPAYGIGHRPLRLAETAQNDLPMDDKFVRRGLALSLDALSGAQSKKAVHFSPFGLGGGIAG